MLLYVVIRKYNNRAYYGISMNKDFQDRIERDLVNDPEKLEEVRKETAEESLDEELRRCDYCGSKELGDNGGEMVHRAVLDYSYRKNIPSPSIENVVYQDNASGKHAHFLVCESCYYELHRNIGLDSMKVITA
jgi:hypothetical protein